MKTQERGLVPWLVAVTATHMLACGSRVVNRSDTDVVLQCLNDSFGDDVCSYVWRETTGATAEETTGETMEATDASSTEETSGDSETMGGVECGDGKIEGSEVCDNGTNMGPAAYSVMEPPDTCQAGCKAKSEWCGDGKLHAMEVCDNGTNMGPPTYSPTMPIDTCQAGCKAESEWCGDGKVNGPEGCDNGVNMSTAYSSTMPAMGACAAGCVVVEWCGDGVTNGNGNEACDGGGVQTANCEADCSAPVCGDGVLNVQAGEVCEDGNVADGDGCSAGCVPERRVFVTSTTYAGDLGGAMDNPEGLTGLLLADYRCEELAEAAGMAGKYKAWLSSAEGWPEMRFDTEFTGQYRLRSAGYPVVAEGWEDLTNGSLLHAIDADESGDAVPDPKNVWTNTAVDGTAASITDDCMGFTVKMNATTTLGLSSETDMKWTADAPGQVCSGTNRLYCFEDGGR